MAMQNPVRKVWHKRMWVYIAGGILLALAIYLVVQGIRCGVAVKNGEEHLATYNAATAKPGYNIGSCRMLEKSGFEYQGTLRSNAVNNGVVIDMKMYSLIKS